MKYVIITLFPEMFSGILNESILKRAIDNKLIDFEFVNLRDFGLGPRKQVDDTPYGGGSGMVLRVDVMAEAIKFAKSKVGESAVTILMTPQGKIFNQEMAKDFADRKNDLILICGHYEGFDERIRLLVDAEISLGKFVLTGGEIPAMAIIDSVSRLIPGVLGREESFKAETFWEGDDIEYPQYTRPEEWQGEKVPDVLISGNHQKIEDWRKEQSLLKSNKYKNSN